MSILTRGELPKNIPLGIWTPPEEALEKIPNFMGEATLNQDGKGFR
ncbi:MAG: hypothetical protein K0M45_03595 [Candidatus Paracaedibacteraceae bacterium]|nr:hypothetical protein [Candidatus Paracaedibacteraceae bacterium]